MACKITTERILEILDEELDVGLNMEYGEGDESDSDIDDTFLEERIWDDLEYNEESVLDHSFEECDSSSNEGGDTENDTGNRTRTGDGTVRGCGRGRGTGVEVVVYLGEVALFNKEFLILVEEMTLLEEDVVQLVDVVYEDVVEDNPNKI